MAIITLELIPNAYQRYYDSSAGAVYEEYWSGTAWINCRKVLLSNGQVTLSKSTTGVMNACVSLTQAQVQAGYSLTSLTGAGFTMTPIGFRIATSGIGGSGNLLLQDTNSSPVVIATISEANLAANAIINESSGSGIVTLGAGFGADLTISKDIQIIGASITLSTCLASVYYKQR